MAISKLNFSHWLFHGYESSPSGIKRIFNWWIVFHVIVGVLLSTVIGGSMKDIARVILLPLMGVLIGLTFAWAGNAQGFIQTKEIIEVSKNKPGGYVDYIFVYQLSIFLVLICTGIWVFAAFDIKEITIFSRTVHPKYLSLWQKNILKGFLYSFLSLTVRETWSVIQGVHYFLIVRNKIFEANEKKKEPNSTDIEHKQRKKKTSR